MFLEVIKQTHTHTHTHTVKVFNKEFLLRPERHKLRTKRKLEVWEQRHYKNPHHKNGAIMELNEVSCDGSYQISPPYLQLGVYL